MNNYKLLSFNDVEEQFGIGVSMLKKLLINKEITVVKVGAKNFMKYVDVMGYIDERTVSKQ